MSAACSVSLLLPRRGEFTLDCSFEFPEKGVTILFGESGSGKTTVLRCVAGLERAEGFVRVQNQVWQDDANNIFLPTWQRALGYVFQEASLFPHMTALQNIEFARRRNKSADSKKRMDDAIDLLGIGALLARKPDELSGGERQRVAIARAVATEPVLMLFDEPLAALDYKRKNEILPWLEKLRENLDVPMLYVTHSAEEVMRLGDHLIVLEQGKIKAQGALQDVLSDIEVPIKIGEDTSSLLKGAVSDIDPLWNLASVQCGALMIKIPANHVKKGDSVALTVLARDIVVATENPEGTSVQNRLGGEIKAIAEIADHCECLLQVNCSGTIIVAKVTKKALADLNLKKGSKVWLLIKSVALLSN